MIYRNIEKEEKLKKINKRYYGNRKNFNMKEINSNNNISNIYKDSFWIRSEASGIKITPDNNSDIFLIDKERNFKFYKHLSKQTFIFQGIKARDLTFSNEQNIFLTDFNDFSIYKLEIKNPKRNIEVFIEEYFSTFKSKGEGTFFVNDNFFEFFKLEGKAVCITAGPYSQPFIIDREGLVQSSSKFGFN